MSTETQKVDVLAPVRAGDLFLSQPGRVATVMRTLPGGFAEIREESDRKPSLTTGRVQVRWLKALPRIGKVAAIDGWFPSALARVGGAK